jgi:hypothetical protein
LGQAPSLVIRLLLTWSGSLSKMPFLNGLSPDIESLRSVTCPVTKCKLYAGKSCYADDLCSKHVFRDDKKRRKSPDVSTIERVLEAHDVKVNSAVNEIGLFQSRVKKEIICSLSGNGSIGTYRSLRQNIAKGIPLSNICTK